MRRHFGRLCLGLSFSGVISFVAFAQSSAVEYGGPLSGPPALNAPFSADATTTVMQLLKDGTRVERKMTARYYRDSTGRVRVEQATPTDRGLGLRVTVFPDPADNVGYLLDPSRPTPRRVGRSLENVAVGGGENFTFAIGSDDFVDIPRSVQPYDQKGGPPVADTVSDDALGSRQISGVVTTGRRVTKVVWVGVLGNDEPIRIVDERWESPELKLLIYSRYSNSRTGDIQYSLTNIQQVEPAEGLFDVSGEAARVGPTPRKPWISYRRPDHPTAQAK